MAEIEMVGGSNFSMSRTDESEIQKGGGGEIEMLGGSDLHMSHSPIGTEQKGGKSGGIDMAGVTDLIDRDQRVTAYHSDRPTDKGRL